MNYHELKIDKAYFEDVVKKRKRFEIRKDDREPAFEEGDYLILRETVESLTDDVYYTGRMVCAQVDYVLRDFVGLAPGYCALGIKVK